jgi:solute carrier family 13 (sodium-dependent dicarboxylate transporter), member 2/3/5
VLPVAEGLTRPGQVALGVFVMAVALWVSGALPLAVTGLLVLASLPLFGAMSPDEAFPLFGNPAVFFILGALVLAAALMTTGLSRRLSLFLLFRFGGSPRKLAAGILVTCALLSCIMPEHAVAAIVFPTVSTITRTLKLEPRRSPLATLLYLSMAWGCVTGGIATMLGGARAALAIGILKETTHQNVDFLAYSAAAAPVAILLTALGCVLLQLFFKPETSDISEAQRELEREIAAAGRWSRTEIKVGVVTVLAIASWTLLGHSVGLATLSLVCASALFALAVVTWSEVEQAVNWGVFLLYGGAIAMGSALTRTGATAWIAHSVMGSLPRSPALVLAVLGALALVLTEFVSNAAAVAVLLPIAMSFAPDAGLDPRLVTVAVAVPAGLAFTLPVGSPPNAIAFSSGYYEVRQAALPGLLMTLLSFGVFLGAAWLFWPHLPGFY